jgi:ribosomal protein L24, bacterial/organelle
MTVAMKIRKGDTVHMLAGKDRGKEGRVIDAMPRERKVLVENLNIVKRHTRPRPMRDSSRMSGPQIEPGGIIEKPAAVPVSRVMLVCPTCSRPTRVAVQIRESKGETRKVRVCKRVDCGQDIDK